MHTMSKVSSYIIFVYWGGFSFSERSYMEENMVPRTNFYKEIGKDAFINKNDEHHEEIYRPC